MTLSYPARMQKDEEGRFLVRFRDLPGAVTDGATLEEATAEAEDLLLSWIAIAMRQREDVPPPSEAKRGERLIAVPLSIAPKLALYRAMRQRSITNTELAQRLGVTEAVVRRMLDPDHDTKAERMRAALRVLGIRLQAEVVAA